MIHFIERHIKRKDNLHDHEIESLCGSVESDFEEVQDEVRNSEDCYSKAF